MIRYTITASNLYPVASVLMHYKIPFEFIPRKYYGLKGYRSRREKNVIEFEMPDDSPFTIANILYSLEDKFGSIFNFTIINEIKYK